MWASEVSNEMLNLSELGDIAFNCSGQGFSMIENTRNFQINFLPFISFFFQQALRNRYFQSGKGTMGIIVFKNAIKTSWAFFYH